MLQRQDAPDKALHGSGPCSGCFPCRQVGWRGGSITPIAPFLAIHQIWLRRGGPVLEGPMLLQEMGLKLKILPLLDAK